MAARDVSGTAKLQGGATYKDVRLFLPLVSRVYCKRIFDWGAPRIRRSQGSIGDPYLPDPPAPKAGAPSQLFAAGGGYVLEGVL